MTMLAEEKNAVLTIEGYEARIHLYKEQIGTGYIGIGRTLNEAKDAGVVPHGEWEAWVERTTGLTIRQAQRCMQAATEIRDGSALARLEMSKALMLLSSGLDEEQRETIAAQAAEDGATVKALKEEIRQAKLKLVQETGAAAEIRDAMKQAVEEREDLKRQLRAREQGWQARMDQEIGNAYQRGLSENSLAIEKETRKEFQAKLDENTRRIRELQEQLRTAGDQERQENRRLQDELEKQIRGNVELHEELKAAEAREAKRAEQLKALQREKQDAAMAGARGVRAGTPDGLDLAAAVREFIGRAGVLPQMSGTLAAMSGDEREAIRAQVETVARWVDGARDALRAVTGHGTVQ